MGEFLSSFFCEHHTHPQRLLVLIGGHASWTTKHLRQNWTQSIDFSGFPSLYWFLKSEMSSLSIGFWTALRAYKYTFKSLKGRRGSLAGFENFNEIQKLVCYFLLSAEMLGGRDATFPEKYHAVYPIFATNPLLSI